MPEGLLAQWQRGIALRGIVGAVLLMVPVLVAATIGFGGVGAGGLTSLAEGPSESAVNVSAGSRDRSSESLDSLSAEIPTAATTSVKAPATGSRDSTPQPGNAATGSPGVGSPPSGDPSGNSGGGASTTGSGVSGAQAPPPSSPSLPQTDPNLVGSLLQGLLGGESIPTSNP